MKAIWDTTKGLWLVLIIYLPLYFISHFLTGYLNIEKHMGRTADVFEVYFAFPFLTAMACFVIVLIVLALNAIGKEVGSKNKN